MINNPCFRCRKRQMGCHAICDDYKEFKKNLEKHSSAMRKEKEAHNDSVGYDTSRKRRLSKAHGKK